MGSTHSFTPIACQGEPPPLPITRCPADCNAGPQPANCHLAPAQSQAFQVVLKIPIWIKMEQEHQARLSSWAKYPSGSCVESCWTERSCRWCSAACGSASSARAAAPSLCALSNPTPGNATEGLHDYAWVRRYRLAFCCVCPLAGWSLPPWAFLTLPMNVLHSQSGARCYFIPWLMAGGAPITLCPAQTHVAPSLRSHRKQYFPHMLLSLIFCVSRKKKKKTLGWNTKHSHKICIILLRACSSHWKGT